MVGGESDAYKRDITDTNNEATRFGGVASLLI